MEYCITPTLLGSLDWFEQCPPSWKDKALADLTNTIKRGPFRTTPEIERGNKFEKDVQRCVENNLDLGSEKFKKVVARCKGGKFQTWCEYYEVIDGVKTRVYGKRDVLKPSPDLIIDIKTTGNYKGPSKYRGGWQPSIYGIASDIKDFEFVVAVFDKGSKIESVEFIPVSNMNLQKERERVRYRSEEFVAFLKKVNLFDAYVFTYCKNKR